MTKIALRVVVNASAEGKDRIDSVSFTCDGSPSKGMGPPPWFMKTAGIDICVLFYRYQ